MSNVYAAPRANLVESVEASNPNFLATNGRIGRVRWLAYVSAMYVIFSIAIGGLGFLLASRMTWLGPWIPMINSIVVIMMLLLYSRRRLQDLGFGPLFLLIGFVPIVNLYMVYLMLLKRGDAGSNKYGLAPAPNNRAVCWIAALFPGIFVLGIVAAIALPAYKSYSDKARANNAPVSVESQR